MKTICPMSNNYRNPPRVLPDEKLEGRRLLVFRASCTLAPGYAVNLPENIADYEGFIRTYGKNSLLVKCLPINENMGKADYGISPKCELYVGTIDELVEQFRQELVEEANRLLSLEPANFDNTEKAVDLLDVTYDGAVDRLSDVECEKHQAFQRVRESRIF